MRPVRRHDRGVAPEFLHKQPEGDARSQPRCRTCRRCQRNAAAATQVLQQEADGDQVKKYAEGARDAVVRNSALAVHVANRHFADRRSVPRSQRRNKAVQFAVERHLLQNLAAIGFERGTEVVDVHAAELRHQPVGAARGKTAQPEVVNAHLAPAADDVVALGNFLEEQRNVRGVVLQIAVHGDDVLAARMIEPGGQCRSLPKIPPQADHRHPAVYAGNLAQQVKRLVRRSVIHQHHFKTFAVGLHHRLQAVVEIGDVFLLVVQGDDDGILGHEVFIIRFSPPSMSGERLL